MEKLYAHIDFDFYRKQLSLLGEVSSDPSKGGRPWYDEFLMLKILILQGYYYFSPDNTEYAILDQLLFMRFLGLGNNDRVPQGKNDLIVQ